MKRQFWILAILLGLGAMHAAGASAQQPDAGGAPSVSAGGMVTIERQAETLRMEVDLLAKGKDLKDALGKLQLRRKAAEKQLAELGAEAKSIRFGAPHISTGGNDQQAQMMAMMRQRMMARRGGRRGADKPAAAAPVTVAMSLTAEWPLAAGEPEQTLLAAHGLEEKIKAADLAGRTAAEELTPEEAELAEEAESEDDNVMYGGRPEPKPGEPRFVYVAKISEADRDQALREAFEQAQANAQRLAKAASAELGSLTQLSGSSDSTVDSDIYNEYGPYQYRMMQRAQSASSSGEQAEAIGVQPGPVQFQVHVMASFSLK